MSKKKKVPHKPRSILDLAPGKLREIDGVVLDLDSFAKHFAPPAPPQHAPLASPADAHIDSPAISPAASPAQDTQAMQWSEPVHIGWYETGTSQAYPIMERYVYAGGSGSGSYLSSYFSSYHTSSTSFRRAAGSGSWMCADTGVFGAGGYGLELI